MKPLEHFFQEIALAWGDSPPPPPLRIIGSAALMLQTNYFRGTKDSDVFETAEVSDADQRRLLRLAGPGSVIATRSRLHIDVVRNGIPFLPQKPHWHPISVSEAPWLELYALDVVDVVVSKLKRFNANDRNDVDAMVERDLVPHDALVDRFERAVDVFLGDARAEELPRYIANLHELERDSLGVPESEFELPS